LSFQCAYITVRSLPGAENAGRKNIVWVRPIEAGTRPIEAQISLIPREDGEIMYELPEQPPP
jgi:hypothetical protein